MKTTAWAIKCDNPTGFTGYLIQCDSSKDRRYPMIENCLQETIQAGSMFFYKKDEADQYIKDMHHTERNSLHKEFCRPVKVEIIVSK